MPGPTPERLSRGDLERVTFHEMLDGHRHTGTHYVVVDVLETMLRAGVNPIKPTQYKAGRRFATDFAAAQFDQLRAPDLSRLPGLTSHGDDEAVVRVAKARESVGGALEVVGGYDSIGGSICWEVLGVGVSVRTWAKLRGLPRGYGPGALRMSLGILQRHYRYV